MKVNKCQIGSEFKRLSIKRFVSGSKVNYIIEGSKCQPNLKGFIEGEDSRYRPIIGTFGLETICTSIVKVQLFLLRHLKNLEPPWR